MRGNVKWLVLSQIWTDLCVHQYYRVLQLRKQTLKLRMRFRSYLRMKHAVDTMIIRREKQAMNWKTKKIRAIILTSMSAICIMFSSGFYTHCCSKSASARTREPFFRLITHPTCWGAVRLPACPPPLTHMNQNDPNILSATASHYTPPEGRLTVAIKNRGLIFVMTVSKCAKRAANCSSFCTHFSSCKMSPQNAFLLPKSIHIHKINSQIRLFNSH